MAHRQCAHWAWQYNTPEAKKLSSIVDSSIPHHQWVWFLCGLVRCFRIYLREKAKMEITTESPLLPWLVRHCGWILSRYAVRADGRTGYSRLKGREYTAGVPIFGEAIWYKLPKTDDLTKLDDRWRTVIWLGKSDRSDGHIIGLETGAVLARSFRRKVEGKRWNERAQRIVTGTPWNPRPGEVVVRRRYITRALIEGQAPTDDCAGCFRKSQHHSERCRARFGRRRWASRGQSPRGAASSTGSSRTKPCLNFIGSAGRWRRR